MFVGPRVMGIDHLRFFSKNSPTSYGSIVLKSIEIKYKTMECTERHKMYS